MRSMLYGLMLAGCSSSWLSDTAIFVQGYGVQNTDCRDAICQHNENTDMVAWNGALWLVHRTALSQVLGPNSALHIYRSDDNAASFHEVATIMAPMDRDLRDPAFYIVGDQLYIKGLTRIVLPTSTARDSMVDTVSVAYSSPDGINWTSLGGIGPHTWSYWRIRQYNGVYYNAAYQDGDLSVSLFSSTDGINWTQGPPIYSVSAMTPLETELWFFPSGKLMALVRTDGDTEQLLGGDELQTQVCWADPPYASFDCPQSIMGQRLDGPLIISWQSRIFVVARKHLGADLRKRTALYELTGDFDNAGMLDIREIGELPSAGDTAYAGAVAIDDHRFKVSWYASNLLDDPSWVIGMLSATDIWLGTIDLAAVPVVAAGN